MPAAYLQLHRARIPNKFRVSHLSVLWQVAIARRYLEPQAQADAGVPAGATRVTDPAMLELITEYARCAPQPLPLPRTQPRIMKKERRD